MASLIARAPIRIGGKALKAGEAFELDERYARTLIATRQAERATETPKPARKPAKAEAGDRPKPKAKTYKTRKLEAGDE
jgi:hypothetical protein